MHSISLRSLPAVIKTGLQTAQLPPNYEEACVAIKQCARIDQCLEWANRMAAAQAYYRQIKDTSLFDAAAKIKARATRRLGELLEEMYPGKYGREIERDAGITAMQAHIARRLAEVPEEKFEASLRQTPVPSPRKIYTDVNQRRHVDCLAEAHPNYGQIDPIVVFADVRRIEELCRAIECFEGTNPSEMAETVTRMERIEEWMDFADFVRRVTALIKPERA